MAISYQFVPYLWVSLTLSVIMISLIFYALRNRSVLGARYFLFTLVLVEIWIAAQGLEMASVELTGKIVWANIQYIPIMVTPVTYLFLILQFSSHEKSLRPRRLIPVLFIVPVITNILVWTDRYFGLIRRNFFLDLSGPIPTLGKTYGPMFIVAAAYNYIISITVLTIIAAAFRDKIPMYRKQLTFLLLAILFPLVSNLLYVMKLYPLNIDITPAVFGLSAVAIWWGIFRYRLFDVIPIARSKIIQEMRTGMIVLDNEGRFMDINPAACRMLELDPRHLSGRSVESVLCGIPELISIYKQGKDGVCDIVFNIEQSEFYYEITFTKIKGSGTEFIGWLLQIYDITERKLAEKIIRHAALHDDMTGLPNKNYFTVLFSQELNLARMRHDSLTTAFMDLDNFKAINDTYGHDIGDTALCEVAERLKKIMRKSDIISRIGGDEFVIIMPHLGSDENIRRVGDKILKAFEDGMMLNGTLLNIKASIGFSVYPRDGENADILLKKADKAMYSVKGSDKNNYKIYRE
ncbi:MAG: histidine kinase N-terminal 7TM domain-containing protein [Bacillota bacterium]|nr:histidine kinase N-terminal 7TM domain-containing protein [Bacillota bacterium]